jgi:hypothetical protein
MQRNFEPMRKQVEAWQKSELTDVTEQYEEFGRERSGVSRTRSLRHSRIWTRSHNLRLRPSWVNSWKPGSSNRSSPWGGVGQPPLLVDELVGVQWRFDVSVDWNGISGSG